MIPSPQPRRQPLCSPARQRGISLGGLILVLAVLGFLAILGMKVLPVYMESRDIANAVQAVKDGAGVQAIRTDFDRRAGVANITSISGKDLDIVKNGAGYDVSYAYEKKIPLFGSASLLLEYAGSSNPNAAAAAAPAAEGK